MTKASLIKSSLSGNELYYDGLHFKTGQCGSFQAANIITAAEVCRALSRQGYMISDKNIEEGINSFFIPGRLECVCNKPLVLLDAAHNEGAMLEFSKTLKNHSQGRRVVALCAFMKDKAYEKAISHLAVLCDKMIFTNVDPLRGESPSVLCESAKVYCSDVISEADCEKAYSLALDGLSDDDILLVSGSFYLVSDIRKKYRER